MLFTTFSHTCPVCNHLGNSRTGPALRARSHGALPGNPRYSEGKSKILFVDGEAHRFAVYTIALGSVEKTQRISGQ